MRRGGQHPSSRGPWRHRVGETERVNIGEADHIDLGPAPERQPFDSRAPIGAPAYDGRSACGPPSECPVVPLGQHDTVPGLRRARRRGGVARGDPLLEPSRLPVSRVRPARKPPAVRVDLLDPWRELLRRIQSASCSSRLTPSASPAWPAKSVFRIQRPGARPLRCRISQSRKPRGGGWFAAEDPPVRPGPRSLAPPQAVGNDVWSAESRNRRRSAPPSRRGRIASALRTRPANGESEPPSLTQGVKAHDGGGRPANGACRRNIPAPHRFATAVQLPTAGPVGEARAAPKCPSLSRSQPPRRESA